MLDKNQYYRLHELLGFPADMTVETLKDIIFEMMQHKSPEELRQMARMMRSQATSCESFAEKGGFQESLRETIRELS